MANNILLNNTYMYKNVLFKDHQIDEQHTNITENREAFER